MSKLAHSCQETMDQIERDAEDRTEPPEPVTCAICGAFEQTREVVETQHRWRKEGPPQEAGWTGPIYPHADLQIYERTKTERYFDCKFICPHNANGSTGKD